MKQTDSEICSNRDRGESVAVQIIGQDGSATPLEIVLCTHFEELASSALGDHHPGFYVIPDDEKQIRYSIPSAGILSQDRLDWEVQSMAFSDR